MMNEKLNQTTGKPMTTKIQTSLTVLLLLLLSAGGCSSWGGKINNTEGVNYYARGEYDQALTAFQTASRLNPDDPEIYYNIASTYQQQALRYQDPTLLTQAETNYRICLQKNPTRETTVCCYRGLATVLNQRKDEKQAMKVLQEWEEKEPNSVEPKLEIAYLLEAQGKNQEAADALTKIKDWAPNDYRAFYKLCLVEEKLGHNEAALEQLRAAARLNPANQDITNKITQLESKGSAPMVGPTADTAQNGAPPLDGAPSASPAFVTRTEPAAPAANAQPTVNAAQTASVQNDPSAPPPMQDGFTPVTGTGEPAFNAPPAAQPPAPDSGAAPSYNSPAPGALPATAPETKPASPPPLDSEMDSLFDSELTKAAPAAPVWTAASPVQPQTAAQAAAQTAAPASAQAAAPVGGVTLPDGTGTAAFKLAYAEAAAAPAASASAANTASNTESSAAKSKIGDPNPGPPRTSVGVPF